MYKKERKLNFGLIAVATAVSFQICGCGGTSGKSTSPNGQVTIVNNRLLRNGAPWVPHGYFQVAFEAPPNVPAKSFETNATQGYTPQEYTDMANAGADSVRLMIAQTGADPDQNVTENPDAADYSLPLVQEFVGAIQAARNAGLTVIVGVQDESVTGEQKGQNLPSAATIRVWANIFTLAPQLKTDTGVLLELFNEPGTGPDQVPTATDWANWAVAMNATIASVRAEKAKNVVVADGLAHAETLTGAPALIDEDNLVAYAAHPYAFSESQEQSTFWDKSFGNFAASNPVIITEFAQGYFCAPDNPQVMVNFLNYLQSHNVGLEMGAWDWGAASFGTSRYDFNDPPNTAAFTSFYSHGVLNTCGTAVRGPGLTVNAWYTTGTVPTNPI
jgi:hypothetical protein